MSAVEERPVEELSPEDGRRLFDDAARRFVGMSGPEFLRAWDQGAFSGDERNEVYHVAMLIPFGR
jgi:hypothetical protein